MAIVDYDTDVSVLPIEHLKMSEGQHLLIGIISSKKMSFTKTHFYEGLGSFHCFEGACCKKLQKPQLKFQVPIVVYSTDLDGELVTRDGELSLKDMQLNKFLNVGKADMELLKQFKRMEEKENPKYGLHTIDLLVTCVDDVYQEKKFVRAGKAKWRKVINKNLHRELLTNFVKYIDLYKGKTYDSEEEFLLAYDHALSQAPVYDRPQLNPGQNRGFSHQKALPKPTMQESDVDVSALLDDENDDMD